MGDLMSLGLSLLGGLSYYLATRWPLWAGVVGLGTQAAWLAFSLIAQHRGFLLSVAIFTVLNLIKLRTGLRARRAEADTACREAVAR